MSFQTKTFCFIPLILLTLSARAQWDLSKMVSNHNGQTVYHSKPVPADLLNPWPQALEKQFQQRAHHIITSQRRDIKAHNNTYFENEKRTYGYLMAHILGGNVQAGLKLLQDQDHQHQEWHRETNGIDYYACFTIKHQMRKYFYFGDLLDPEYKQQMYDGAKNWTQQDPFKRPHYAYKGPKPGWGPDARNSWVDIRSTENLYLMRVTSVYLMAEETNNHKTAARYKQHILNYTKTLYRVGIGEWDSENYHGHSIAPCLNLYDFAEDQQVKAAAKACLDFFAAAGAVKYWRGGFNGPTKRDYNHPQPFGGSAPNSLWVWFGDHPHGKTDHWESDEVHQITSAYRPPLAVVHLARKNFNRPIELFAGKPSYNATTTYKTDSQPEYLESQYIANSYLMGSLTGGTSPDGGDVNGFKILAFDNLKGAVALHATPGGNPQYPGSPMYQKGIVSSVNRVAQQENIAIWLTKDGNSPWIWVIPRNIKVSYHNQFTILECDRTWVAIHPLGTTPFKLDENLTHQLTDTKKQRFPNHKVLSATGNSRQFSGLAIEVGEKESHQSLVNFINSIKKATVEDAELNKGIARYKAADGKYLGFHWNDDPLNLGVWRNGRRRDLKAAANHLYKSDVINAEWGAGILNVNAGGHTFKSQVDQHGNVTFTNSTD